MPWLLLQPELLGPFFVIVGAIVISALANIASAQHGSENTGGFWDTFFHDNPLAQIFGQIAKFNRYVVSRFAGAHLRQLARWLMALGTVAIGNFTVPALFAEAVEEAIGHIYTRGDPKARRAARHAQTTATHGLHVAHRAEVGVKRDAANLNRYKAVTNPRIHHLTHATEVTLPHDIARVRRREEALSRDQAKLRERTTSLENGAVKTWRYIRAHPFSFATTAFAGAVAVALGRLGLGGLRCNNFKSLLRHYGCGLGTLLGRLLPLAVFLAASFDFPEFCRAARLVATGIGDAVQKIEGAFDPQLPPLPPPL